MKASSLLIIWLVLILTMQTIAKIHKGSTNTEKVHMSIVESNHFSSEHELSTTYSIDSVEKNKPLIFILKPSSEENGETIKDNPKTITLVSGSHEKQCIFDSYYDLCSLKNIEETDMKLKIKCKKLPCTLSWVIHQPSLIQADGKQSIEELVEVNNEHKHAILEVSCNKPDLSTFSEDMELYTNSKYKKVLRKGKISYLFNNQDKGYLYLTSKNQAAKDCAQVSIKHPTQNIKFNKKNDLLTDFLLLSQPNIYEIDQKLTSDFRLDCSINDPTGKDFTEKAGVEITFLGKKDSVIQQISKVKIDFQSGRSYYDFSVVFKNTEKQYNSLKLSIKAVDVQLIMVASFRAENRQQIELSESSFFSLKSGDKIEYKIIPEEDEKSEERKTHIFVDDKKFKASQKSCSLKKGCQFTLEALVDASGKIYIGEQQKENVKETVYFAFDKSITKKARDGDTLYLKTKLKAKKAIQIVVNSPSVIIHAASASKCASITDSCYDKVLNSNNPSIMQQKEDGQLLLRVSVLDNCEFTLTILSQDSQYISLKDSQPFAYLFDDKQNSMYFTFKISKKEVTNFNLIGPTNELNLIVVNSDKYSDDNNALTSADGYINFPQEEIDGLNFVIKVQKIEQFRNKYIHFTIIASTKFANVRLEPGASHYETILSKDKRYFVFQFQPKKSSLINFYSQNLNTGINLEMQVSKTDAFDKNVEVFTIDQSLDVLDLKDISQKLCKELDGENCEIYLQIKNLMDIEVDITITLLLQDSIIQLKDGVWQLFSNNQKNSIASTNHFYFLPKHPNKSVNLFYKSTFIDLKLVYKIWKTDDKSINPAEWPFPIEIGGQTNKKIAGFSPTQHILIDSKALSRCWPNCVILVSLLADKQSMPSTFKIFGHFQSYSIMSSNNFIDLPEKTKLNIAMSKDEQKLILIDLKHLLQKNALTFFTYLTIGSLQFLGNVYSQKNPRCPTIDEPGDFRFGNVETQISVSTIKRKITENSMDSDNNLYICILAKPFLDSKFSIEYSSENQIIKQLTIDSFENANIENGKVVLYQVDATQQFYVKISRNLGFPYIQTKLCKEGEGMEDCLDQFRESKEKGKQLVEKMTSVYEEPCEKCIFFLKITTGTQAAAGLTIHLQSKYAEIELIQNQIVTDSVEKNEENKYTITSLRDQQMVININILQGEIEAHVFDFQEVNIIKSNKKQQKNIIHIVIPTQNKEGKKETQHNKLVGLGFIGAYDNSRVFNNMHLAIKSQDSSKTALYTISYSCGQSELYLQDGLITQFGLMQAKTTKFIYSNPSLQPIYLHLSMASSEAIKNIKTKIYSVVDPNDEDTMVEMTPERPNFKKKTPNPTMMMQLPAHLQYLIEVINNNKQLEIITIGINNREIIYLPLAHQFPLQLSQNQFIYVLIYSAQMGYVKITVSKCDQSSPTLSYTLNYDDFIKEEFQNQQEIQEEIVTDLIIHVKKPSNIYLKIKSPINDKSLLLIHAVYSGQKFKELKTKAGDKGLIQYQMLEQQKAEISFSPLVCPSTSNSCKKDFVYSALSSSKIQNVYSHLVCSAVNFDLEDVKILNQADTQVIDSSRSTGSKIRYNVDIKEAIEYVGVRALNSKTGEIVYYKPIQIVTVWGQISRGSRSNFFVVAIIVISSLCCGLLFIRRVTRSKDPYSPIDSNDN